MGINLRGGDFRGIFAIPAKKKEYRAKKTCDIIKWLLGCCRFEQKKDEKKVAKIFGREKERLYLCTRFSGITDTHCERSGEERAKDL